MIGGMVASPTPIVPMSGDSMTVMAQPKPGRARARMAAAIQPAVPPPTMAMRLSRRSPPASEARSACRMSVISP